MKDDKKKVATMIIAKMKPNGSDEMSESPKNEVGDPVESDMGLDAASEEILMSIDKKDPAGLKSALKSFLEMCEYGKE